MTLPEGWVEATVGDLGEYLNGMAFKPSDWEGEGVGIIRIQNLTDPSKPLNKTQRAFDERYRVRKGDLLVSWSATLDAFIWDREDAILNQHIFKVTPSDCVDRDFLFYQLREAIAEMAASEHLHGSTMKHINRGPFLAHCAALPPMAEQRRIVAKLDALTARLARARAELDRVPVLAAKLRQAALDEEYAGSVIGEPAALGELGSWSSGGTPKSSEATYYGGSIPWLRSGDLPDGRIEAHVVSITDQGLQASSAKWVPAGAVLIAMYGATIGKLGITTYPVTTNQAVACIVPARSVSANWLFYLLLQKRPELVALGQGGAQPNISQQILKGIMVLRPNLDHQLAVEARLNAAFARADRMEAEAARARALIDRLEAAILGRAFRGELVPQDPNDEPASVLLDRIRAQRAAAPKPKRGRRAKASA